MKPTTERTVTPAQREADKQRVKTTDGQDKLDALRAKLAADLRDRAAQQAVQPKTPKA